MTRSPHMRKIPLMIALASILGMLCGCVETMTDPVQVGYEKYKIDGPNENSNAKSAQQFCRRKGFDYAEVTWTHRGLTVFDPDETNFFCMHNGETLTRAPSIEVNVW
jgi:hypothetical protein